VKVKKKKRLLFEFERIINNDDDGEKKTKYE